MWKNQGIFYGRLSIPHNIVMNVNNVIICDLWKEYMFLIETVACEQGEFTIRASVGKT